MAKLSIVAGATSQSITVFVQNSSSTVGAGLTGLVWNSTGILAYYTFTGTNTAATQITLATLAAVNSAYSSGGFKEIDSTNMPGVYRLDLPNAVIASGKGRSVVVYLQGVTNMAPCVLEIELTGLDNQDGVRGGMTALPNAAASAVGGLPLSVDTSGRVDALKINGTSQTARDIGASVLVSVGTGAGQVNVSAGKVPATLAATDVTGNVAADLQTVKTQAVTCGAGVTVLASVGTAATSTAQTGDTYARLGAPAGASVSADVAALKTDLDAGTAVQTGLTAQGYTTTRASYLDTLSGLVAAIWAYATRTLSAFAFSVTVGTNSDKTGYALTSGEHTNIAADAQTGLTAQGYTTVRAPKLDNLDTNVGSRSTYAGADTSGTTTLLARVPTFPTNFSSLSIDGSGRVTLVPGEVFVKKNTAITITFPMTDSTDHAPATGLTVAARRSIDGAAIASCANPVSEISLGLYALTLAGSDVNGTMITLILSATGADTRFIGLVTQP